MKTIFVLIFSVIAFTSFSQDSEVLANALETQPSLTVKCDLLQFNKETQNGYTGILSSSVTIAEKQWKQFMETTHTAEVKKSKGALVSENVSAPDICKENLTISAFFNEDEDGCRMKVFFERDGSYIFDKENRKEDLAVKVQLKAFMKKLYVVTYESVLEEQRKSHEGEAKKLEKLEKEAEKISKEINSEDVSVEKAENEIIDAEAKISELQAKIEGLKGEIQTSIATKAQLTETKENKTKEIINQKGVVDTSAARIEKLKSSAEKLN